MQTILRSKWNTVQNILCLIDMASNADLFKLKPEQYIFTIDDLFQSFK